QVDVAQDSAQVHDHLREAHEREIAVVLHHVSSSCPHPVTAPRPYLEQRVFERRVGELCVHLPLTNCRLAASFSDAEQCTHQVPAVQITTGLPRDDVNALGHQNQSTTIAMP